MSGNNEMSQKGVHYPPPMTIQVPYGWYLSSERRKNKHISKNYSTPLLFITITINHKISYIYCDFFVTHDVNIGFIVCIWLRLEWYLVKIHFRTLEI